jgi:hypothetical protein
MSSNWPVRALVSAHQRLVGAAVGIGHDIGDQPTV